MDAGNQKKQKINSSCAVAILVSVPVRCNKLETMRENYPRTSLGTKKPTWSMKQDSNP
jgi:hypothetical protein